MQQARKCACFKIFNEFRASCAEPTASQHRRRGETSLVGPCGVHASPAAHPVGGDFLDLNSNFGSVPRVAREAEDLHLIKPPL